MRKFPFLHISLFVLTVLSTLLVGAAQTGADLIEEPSKIYKGIPFSLTLMIILQFKEAWSGGYASLLYSGAHNIWYIRSVY
jgi:hypothetical protein